jgi:translation elongation factor EF-Tu-like GTPase
MMNTFRFVVNEAFCICGRGVVFRGSVIEGEAKPGLRVEIPRERGSLSAAITTIAIGRTVAQASVLGKEIGLLLENFSEEPINRLILESRYFDENSPGPDLIEFLGLALPVEITASSSYK